MVQVVCILVPRHLPLMLSMRSDRCDLSQAARCHILPSVAYPAAFPTLHRVLSVKDRLVFKKHLADSHRDKSNSSTIFFPPSNHFLFT